MDDRRIKVLYIQAVAGGGSMIALYELLKKIDTTIVEPVVLCYYKNNYSSKFEELEYCKVIYFSQAPKSQPVRFKKYSKISGFLTAQINVAKTYFKANKLVVDQVYNTLLMVKPDLVHFNNDVYVNRADIRAVSKAGVASVLHFRSMTNYKNNVLNYLFDYINIRKVDFKIYITEAVKKHHERVFKLFSEKYAVLPDIVDVSKHSEKADPLTKKNLDISDDELVITNIGRITEWKGQHVLIEAINIVKDVLGKFKVLIVGSSESGLGSEDYLKYLKHLTEKYELERNVIFTGNREDVNHILAITDIAVHTAVRPEPQGLVIIEALLAKKKVIASNAGGAKELVQKYGGVLVEPGNPSRLAEAILQIIGPTEVATSARPYAANYERLIHDFNSVSQISQIMALYKKVIASSHVRNSCSK